MAMDSPGTGGDSMGLPPSPPTVDPSFVPPAEPATAPAAAPSSRSGAAFKIATVVLLIAAIAFGGLWVSERNHSADLQAQIDRTDKQADKQQAAADALPDLYEVANAVSADDEGVDYTGDGESLDIEISYPSSEPLAWLEEYLDELGFPGATVDRMEQTRALDGTLDAQGDHATATWTYHPDDGLSVVLSVDD